VFDIIGKKRWFFLISLLVTIPGLFFILLTPLTGGKEGLQFSIDYTGGTTWQIRFADPDVSADAVAATFRENGLQAIVVKQGNKFMDIKTEAIGLLAAPPTPAPTAPPTTPPTGPATRLPSREPSCAPRTIPCACAIWGIASNARATAAIAR
jgi:hypothetical protein